MIRRAVSSSVLPMIFPTDASRVRLLLASCGEAKPSPMSVEPARALSRNGTCLRNRATTKPRTATGTVHRNTVWMVSAYASTMGADAGAGSRCTPSGLVEAPAITDGSAAPVRTAAPTPSRRWGPSALA